MLIIFVFLEIKIKFVNLLYEIHFNILNIGTKTKGYLEIKVMELGTKTETKPKPIPFKMLRTKTRGSVITREPANTVSNSFGDFSLFSTHL
jgi:hypothetical protein